eukprot:CAMPEP_0170562440 /NCGR_PEP_ID=MMETSP0211-20121228/60562_1 /TAXON_ID=311385 /ORGANISM="Pseudokeronopsis sp., Strain OXSARD2" /LENGTH=65 /DNA_ID=CAMNT_0010879321 /DNA_START=63 /DNA_END=260 /DNA_ORIENTATION=+
MFSINGEKEEMSLHDDIMNNISGVFNDNEDDSGRSHNKNLLLDESTEEKSIKIRALQSRLRTLTL